MEQSIAVTDHRRHKQLFSLNLIRAVAIMLVVLDHCLQADLSPGLKDFLQLAVSPNAMLFFMVSGALLLPVTGSWGDFLRRRVTRVFVPFVVWTLIYAVVYYAVGIFNEVTLANHIRWGWLSYNFQAGWFVPAIMGIYLLMPLLSPWIARATRRQFGYVLVIWLLSGMMPWFSMLGGVKPESTMFYMFMSGLPFAIMGYYYVHYRKERPLIMSLPQPAADDNSVEAATRRRSCRRRLVLLYAGLLLGALILPFLLRNVGKSVSVMKVAMHGWSIHQILMGIFYFTLLLRVRTLGVWLDKAVNIIAKYSFGIYLSQELFHHIIILRYLPDIFASTVATFLVTFGASFLLTALLRRTPFFGRYLT